MILNLLVFVLVFFVEKKKREASQAATAVAHALVDHLNTGYVYCYPLIPCVVRVAGKSSIYRLTYNDVPTNDVLLNSIS